MQATAQHRRHGNEATGGQHVPRLDGCSAGRHPSKGVPGGQPFGFGEAACGAMTRTIRAARVDIAAGDLPGTHARKVRAVFVAWKDLRFAKGRFALMGSVIVLITVLVGLVSGLTAGLGCLLYTSPSPRDGLLSR